MFKKKFVNRFVFCLNTLLLFYFKVEIVNELGEIKTVTISQGDSMETDVGNFRPPSLTRESLDYHLSKNLDYHLRLQMHHTKKIVAELEAKINSSMTSNSASFPGSSGSFAVAVGGSPVPISTSSRSFEPTIIPNSTTTSSLLITNPTMTNELDLKVQHTNSRIDMLQNNHQHMLNDVTRLLKVIENSKLENRILKESLKEVKQMAQDLHKTLAINQVSILALEERLINLEKISYDGNLLWRINNVSERIQEAKSGFYFSISKFK